MTTPWYHPDRHFDRRPLLIRRGSIARAVHDYFQQDGFTEVECGALQVTPGLEAHLHGVKAELHGPDGTPQHLYLHTSPEFACKKLLAAGERLIYALARVYRSRERGPLHAPEFTMLEWYRAEAPYERVMADAVALARLAAEAAGTGQLSYRGAVADPRREPERLTVAEAFERHAGIDLMATLDRQGNGRRDVLATLAAASGLQAAADDTWSDLFSKILVARVEPRLGMGRLTLLTDYPAAEAALARRCPGDCRLSERFELYAAGVELANGFGELTDPVEQRQRFEAEMAEKQRIHGERYPLDEELLAALQLMPPASGVALGFDRLVMLATGARRIDEVMWTPPPF
jgi:elongation factor P--(R)-beta-lysine ligase